jgi:hypothetical protein
MTRGYFLPILMSLYIDTRVMSVEYTMMISHGLPSIFRGVLDTLIYYNYFWIVVGFRNILKN